MSCNIFGRSRTSRLIGQAYFWYTLWHMVFIWHINWVTGCLSFFAGCSTTKLNFHSGLQTPLGRSISQGSESAAGKLNKMKPNWGPCQRPSTAPRNGQNLGPSSETWCPKSPRPSKTPGFKVQDGEVFKAEDQIWNQLQHNGVWKGHNQARNQLVDHVRDQLRI